MNNYITDEQIISYFDVKDRSKDYQQGVINHARQSDYLMGKIGDNLDKPKKPKKTQDSAPKADPDLARRVFGHYEKGSVDKTQEKPKKKESPRNAPIPSSGHNPMTIWDEPKGMSDAEWELYRNYQATDLHKKDLCSPSDQTQRQNQPKKKQPRRDMKLPHQ